MDKFHIIGGHKLKGTIRISGSKNAALPLMVTTLLTDEPVILDNVPHLQDIETMKLLLTELGVSIKQMGEHTLQLQSDNIRSRTAPYDIVRKMRSSSYVLGPLLTRFREASLSLPGGCAIGVRPINFHIDALVSMGAKIKLEKGYVHAKAARLRGTDITFPVPSVGATINVMMAAALADGTTTITNAAEEPHVQDVANFLVRMGAKISGVGTRCITVEGVEKLGGARHRVIPDQIETGTYILAAGITRGKVRIEGSSLDMLPAETALFRKAGLILTPKEDDAFEVDGTKDRFKGVDVRTDPYPGFPTDLQAQMMAFLTVAGGPSLITETIFENRFLHVPELMRMGADLSVQSAATVLCKGNSKLVGAEVMASDLRASAGLVIAALAAEGETVVNRIYHLDRGYEALPEKLSACGAKITRAGSAGCDHLENSSASSAFK